MLNITLVCRYLQRTTLPIALHVHTIGQVSMVDALRHQQNGFCVHLGECYHEDTPVIEERYG